MLKKLSLALIAMSSINFASATDLSSAIKGVELNGFLRLDLDYDRYSATPNQNGYTDRTWTTDAKLVFGVPVSETTKMVVRINAEKSEVTNRTRGSEESDGSLQDSMFYLNYKKDKITSNFGLIPLDFLPYASSDDFSTAYGAGLDATYKVGNITLAVGYVDQIFNADEISGSESNDIYTLGAIYDNDKISAKLWYAKITDLLKYDVLAMSEFDLMDIKVNFDVAQSKLDVSNAKTHNYLNLAFSTKLAGIDAKIGLAKTNKANGKINTSSDAEIGTVVTEQRYNIANETGVKDFYLELSYDISKALNIAIDYNHIAQSVDYGDGNSNEYEISSTYQINKKFAISAYYDILTYSNSNATDTNEAEIEFEYDF